MSAVGFAIWCSSNNQLRARGECSCGNPHSPSVDPHAWLTDTLTKLVNRWPAPRIDELMPWAFTKIPA